jgi:hypothetical protein
VANERIIDNPLPCVGYCRRVQHDPMRDVYYVAHDDECDYSMGIDRHGRVACDAEQCPKEAEDGD